jgi:hypothetical protein
MYPEDSLKEAIKFCKLTWLHSFRMCLSELFALVDKTRER